MNDLSKRTRLSARFGIKTKEYKRYEQELEWLRKNKLRRAAFLNQSRQRALRLFPELAPVYVVKDRALAFYQDVLISSHSTMQTNKRNVLRAEAVAMDAIGYLEQDKVIPDYEREGRQEEAGLLRAEELRTLRDELNASFEENARIDESIKRQAQARYANYSDAYFSNPDEAIKQHPELAVLIKLKKQAVRYYKQWVKDEHQANVIKDCLNRAIKDIAKGHPVQTAEEIKAHAIELRSSLIGHSSNVPHTDKKRLYDYPSISLTQALIGKNGIETGLWPYRLESSKEVERIKSIDKQINLEQLVCLFNTATKEQVLDKHPKMSVLHNKYEAALSYYQQKIPENLAQLAAFRLISPDFEKVIDNEPLLAVSEIAPEIHQGIIDFAQDMLHKKPAIEAKAQEISLLIKQIAGLHESLFDESLTPSNDELKEQSPSMSINERLEAANDVDKEAIPPSKNQLESMASLKASNQAVNERDVEFIEVNSESVSLKLIVELAKQKQEQEGLNAAAFLEAYCLLNFVSDLDKERLKDYFIQEGLLVEEQQPEIMPQMESEVIAHQTPAPSTSLSNCINVNTLQSTAPPLALHALFDSPYQSKVQQSQVIATWWDTKAIEAGLTENAKELAILLLGEPLSRDSNQLRFGSKKGSLQVTIAGDKKGLWFDHQTEKGGKMLNLIMSQKECGFKEALAFAGEYLGLSPETREKQVIDVSDVGANFDKKTKDMISYARALANQSKPIEGTLAETYLQKHRQLDASLVSDNVRFIASVKEKETQKYLPAMLVVGKSVDGQVQSVQLTFLDKNGDKYPCEQEKRTYGPVKGAAIAVHQGGNIVAVAEGVETALSIAKANPDLTVFASLGSITNFSAMALEGKGNTVVICADNDDLNDKPHQKIAQATLQLQQTGFNVLVTKPQEPGKDFNDVLKEKGAQAIKAQLAQAQIQVPPAHRMQQSQSKERAFEKKREVECELGL